MQVSTIGVDLAKNVFQVHGVDSAGKVVITRQLRRTARCGECDLLRRAAARANCFAIIVTEAWTMMLTHADHRTNEQLDDHTDLPLLAGAKQLSRHPCCRGPPVPLIQIKGVALHRLHL
jgi:hypothetical protein